MIRRTYRESRLMPSARGTLDPILIMLIAGAGIWALIMAAIVIIGAQQS